MSHTRILACFHLQAHLLAGGEGRHRRRAFPVLLLQGPPRRAGCPCQKYLLCMLPFAGSPACWWRRPTQALGLSSSAPQGTAAQSWLCCFVLLGWSSCLQAHLLAGGKGGPRRRAFPPLLLQGPPRRAGCLCHTHTLLHACFCKLTCLLVAKADTGAGPFLFCSSRDRLAELAVHVAHTHSCMLPLAGSPACCWQRPTRAQGLSSSAPQGTAWLSWLCFSTACLADALGALHARSGACFHLQAHLLAGGEGRHRRRAFPLLLLQGPPRRAGPAQRALWLHAC